MFGPVITPSRPVSQVGVHSSMKMNASSTLVVLYDRPVLGKHSDRLSKLSRYGLHAAPQAVREVMRLVIVEVV